jgi:hypothetical protein
VASATDKTVQGSIRANRGTIMAAGQPAAGEQKTGKLDPLANLNPRERKLVEDTLQAYPKLTPEEAIEILHAFGGL